MKRDLLCALLLTLAAAGNAPCQLIKGKELPSPWKHGNEEHLLTTWHYRFPDTRIDLQMLRKKSRETREVWRFGSNLGRFSASFFSLAPHGGGALHEPKNTWMTTRADRTTLAEIELPVGKNEIVQGTVTLTMAELKAFPDWLFFRLTVNGGATLASFSISARVQEQNRAMGGTSSRLFLAWPDGSCGSGERPLWADKKPAFNALAFFARGNGEEAKSDFMVFDPGTIAAIRFQRWDSVALLIFTVAAAPEYRFALGCSTRDESENVAIPAFMASGRQAILAAMNSLSWQAPQADLGQVGKILAEIAALLKEYPEAGLQQEFDRLSTAAKTLNAKDLAGVDKIMETARQLAEKIAEQALKTP